MDNKSINNINEYLNILRNCYEINTIEEIIKSEKLNFHNNQKFVFIIGNTSCDLDSFVSCLLLSLFKNLLNNAENFDANKLKNSKVIYLPVFNCKSYDFCDRLDIFYLLKQYNISTQDLIFIDNPKLQEDFTLMAYLDKNNDNEAMIKETTKEQFNNYAKIFEENKEEILLCIDNYREIILVDHNKLDENQTFLKNYVTEIIDHHVDHEGKINYKNLKKKTLIYPLGSSSSLILLENISQLEENVFYEAKKSEAIKFMKNSFKDLLIFISAVLIDTRNFLPTDLNVRWNNLDSLAYNKIIKLNKKFCKIENKKQQELQENKEAEILFQNLINSKYDLEANLNLGINKLLNKDKKEFNYDKKTSVIWSSLQVPLNRIIEKFGLINLKENIQEALINKTLYLMNYRQKEDNITYTFVVVFINKLNEYNNGLTLDSLCEKLKKFLREELKEDFLKDEIIDDCFCLIKLKDAITRKNFEPVLNKYFRNDINK